MGIRFDGTAIGRRQLRPRICLLGCLLSTVLLQGCTSDAPSTKLDGWASMTFDGRFVGDPWDTSFRPISCKREPEDGPLVRLVSDDDRWMAEGEWVVEGGIEIDLRLELPGPGRDAGIELTIRNATYRSGSGTKMEFEGRPGDRGIYRDDSGATVRIEGLPSGRAVFRHVPLVQGNPFEGKQRLERVVIAWDCLGRPCWAGPPRPGTFQCLLPEGR
jgi:hypothetical protein